MSHAAGIRANYVAGLRQELVNALRKGDEVTAALIRADLAHYEEVPEAPAPVETVEDGPISRSRRPGKGR